MFLAVVNFCYLSNCSYVIYMYYDSEAFATTTLKLMIETAEAWNQVQINHVFCIFHNCISYINIVMYVFVIPKNLVMFSMH